MTKSNTQWWKEHLRREAHEYLKVVDVPQEERREILAWVRAGNSVHSNPWYIYGENGCQKDYISALRDVEFLEEQHANAKCSCADAEGPPF